MLETHGPPLHRMAMAICLVCFVSLQAEGKEEVRKMSATGRAIVEAAPGKASAPPAWDFSPGKSCGWYHSGQWQEIPKVGAFWRLVADDTPEVRIPRGGMTLISPEFTTLVSVRSGDGVAAVLRSSRTGWVTLYYAEMVAGAKGDFGAERSERRLLYASPDFQTFRIRPRWQDGARICKLRLDGPGFGGRLDIQSIRFFRRADSPRRQPAARWDFRQPRVTRGVLGNQPPPNLRHVAGGIGVRGNDGPGMVTLDTTEIDADANPWVRIRMRVGAGPMGGIAFHPTNRGTDEKMRRYWAIREFMKWFHFRVRTDGESHTYNLRLSDYDYAAGKNPDQHNRKRTGFEGLQRVFHIMPSHSPDAESCLESVSFGPQPEGPVCLVTEYAGAAQAVLRQGRPGVIAVRLCNSGGETATGLAIERTDGNSAVTIDLAGARGIPRDLPPDSTSTLYLDVTAAAPGTQGVSLKVSCQGDQLKIPIALAVEPLLELEQGVIPEPRPIKTDYHIGAYYFTGWSDLTHWPKLPSLAERRPALGYYSELSPQVADWDIKWAVEHGIDHFVVLWYHYNGKQRTRFIEDALLKAKFLPHIKFCVMWCNASNPWWKYTEQDFVDITDYWIKNYFPHEQYRRDEKGRPIAWMLQGWNMAKNFGKDNAVRLMRGAEVRARAAGFPGIHWIACQHGGKRMFDDPADLQEIGFEEWTAYNINGQKSYPYPVVPAQTVVDSAPVIWGKIPVKPVLPVFCGWNNRWVGREFTYCYGFTPGLFRKHLAQARAYLDRSASDSMVIDCWNEWGEGEVLGPNAEYGFSLLKEIPKVFAPGELPRPVVVPEDIGATVPQMPGLWERVNRPPFHSK
jgi:hypothetical protein